MKSIQPAMIATLFFWLLSQSISCSSSSSPPQDTKVWPHGLNWSVDTLAYPGSIQTQMNGIWGSSPTDVYTVGNNERGFGKMYHFDGLEWTDVKLSVSQGGTIVGAIDLWAIQGINANHILAVGERLFTNPSPPPSLLDSALVIEFNGALWQELPLVGRHLFSVWGASSQDFWVCGSGASLFHHDGQQWTAEEVPISFPTGGQVLFRSIAGTPTTGDVYLSASVWDTATFLSTKYFMKRGPSGWAAIDSFVSSAGPLSEQWGVNRFWGAPWGILYSVGDAGAYRWDGSSWARFLALNETCTSIFGTSENSVFVTVSPSRVLFYNGKSWSEVENLTFQNVGYTAIWTDGVEIFVVGQTSGSGIGKSIIAHGK